MRCFRFVASSIITSPSAARCVAKLSLLSFLLGGSAHADAVQGPVGPGFDLQGMSCMNYAFHSQNQADLKAGLANCSEVIARKNENPEKIAAAFAGRGWIEFQLGGMRNPNPAALADFDSSIAVIPNFVLGLEGRAILYLNTGRNAQAITDYTKLITINSNDAHFFIGRGDAENNLQLYDAGITDFDKAIKLDPNEDEAMNDRAWALEKKGDFPDALAGYNAAFAVATGDMRGTILENRCETEAAMGQSVAAIADCNAALQIAPTDEWAFEVRGFANLMAKQLKAAFEDYNAALSRDPTDAEALYGRGITELRMGRRVVGRIDIQSAMKRQPSISKEMALLGIDTPSGL